jgi:hypothetical protein
MTSPVHRPEPGGPLVLTFGADIVDVLTQIARELEQLMASQLPGPVTDRLFPRAYLDPTEEAAELEWQAYVHDDLSATKLGNVAELLADLERAAPTPDGTRVVTLDEAGEIRWLTVLNDARLMLGTALGITEDAEPEFDDDDPRAGGLVLYAWLGQLQELLVEVLLDEMPEEGTAGEPEY